jgi:hypothetical protein
MLKKLLTSQTSTSLHSVLWIRIRIQRDIKSPQKYKNNKKFHVLKSWMELELEVFHGSLGRT